MSGVSLPAAFRRRAERPASLPRWPMGRIRIVDIVPYEAGPLVAGREVIVTSRDGFFESVDETSALSWWCAQIRIARCRLEQTLDDQGRPALVVSDEAFHSVMPRDVPPPLIMAAYHAAFVKRLLGGVCDSPPHWLCLYRNARLLCPERESYGLANLASDILPREMETFFSMHEFARLWSVQTLATDLLHRCRPNMMVAVSAAIVPPPERLGCLGDVVEYDDMEGLFFHDFE
ncbi:hypothetical protein JK222_10565 [Gluconobacter cerinus]|uniref:hypothetical protein n=1 Tax=Gluconobacter cerinus TaxID=38307 RepID=UPI001B8D4880|nr:hypothetical protein [Gluconobacter cerinus]MBS1072137.1 hypothetical protein [Gluconobacter cerinus]